MRNLIIILFLLGAVYSCKREVRKTDTNEVKVEGSVIPSHYDFYIKEIDSCEYIILQGSYAPTMLHKANCKNHETKKHNQNNN